MAETDHGAIPGPSTLRGLGQPWACGSTALRRHGARGLAGLGFCGPWPGCVSRTGPSAAQSLTRTRSHRAAVWHTRLSPRKHATSGTQFPASSGPWHSLGSRNATPPAAFPPHALPLHSQPHIQMAQSVKAQSDPLHPATWGTTGPLVSLLLSPALSAQPLP